MKSYLKIELARAAGVSRETLRKWLKMDKPFLEANHVSPYAKMLPPNVVSYLCKKYDIDLPE